MGNALGFGTTPEEGVLANAVAQARERGFHTFPIVDVDSHHYEQRAFRQIAEFIEEPTIKRRAFSSLGRQGRSSLMPGGYGNQDVAGRIVRPGYSGPDTSAPAIPGMPDVVNELKHSMGQMGIDYSVVFPTTMLSIGMHPEIEVEAAICRAYARWMTECVLPCDPGILTMLPLPFNDQAASLDLVERYAETPGVVGFMVTSVRQQPVHDRKYFKVYAAIEELGVPLGFHTVSAWDHPSQAVFNRYLSVHALGFPLFNMMHLINIVVNGIPERFPRLRLIWIEAGVSWIPFLMQRLDNEYMMRPSEAPLLTKKPSEYMAEFYYTSQPLEIGNVEVLQATFNAMRAETQLLYASDYPHWDFDLPSRIYDLGFLSEEAKRRILGENALALFNLPRPARYSRG